MIKTELHNVIIDILSQMVKSGMLSTKTLTVLGSLALTPSRRPEFGDFALNAALVIAKAEGRPPREVADCIVKELQHSLIAKVEVAGPGFINIFLSDEAVANIIPYIASHGDRYGYVKRKAPKKVLVEFVSANPTGGLHLGHARGAFLGDALARLLKASGHDVVTEFYVNDMGNQVETLGRTIHKRYRELFGESVVIEKGEYPGEYVIDIARALMSRDGRKWLDCPENEWLPHVSRFGIDYNLAAIKDSLNKLDISIDRYYLESLLHEGEKLAKLVAVYKQRGMLYEAAHAEGNADKIRREGSKAAQFAHLQEGGTFLKTSQFGDDEDRIIRRKDGRFVYLVADLCYHNDKFERGFDEMVDVFGADHGGHVARIKAGMAALGHDAAKLQFVLVQMVRLIKEGREVRFSKRSGEVLGIDEVIEMVGSDVARFVFLMRSANAQFDLDLDLITKNSQENPVFYVQYGHARMANILKKASEEKGIVVDATSLSVMELKALSLPEERALLLKMSELEDVVRDAADSLEPHKLLYFAQELIKLFHGYFTSYRSSEKIIGDDPLKTAARLKMVFALKLTIKSTLGILGLSAPDYMEYGDHNDMAPKV